MVGGDLYRFDVGLAIADANWSVPFRERAELLRIKLNSSVVGPMLTVSFARQTLQPP